MLQFTAHLHANTLIPRNVVQSVMSNMSTMISNSLINPLQEIIFLCLSQGQISTEWSQRLVRHLNTFNNSLQDVRSEDTRLLLYKNKGTYIEPKDYVIGQRMENSYAKNNFSLMPVTATGQSISLQLVLNFFMEMHYVHEQTIQCYNEYMICSDSNVIKNIVQGSEWQKKLVLETIK